MSKKGQFYFIAVIILATIFISFITLSNNISYTSAPKLSEEQGSINTEIASLMDYFSRNQISSYNQTEIFLNFSKYYINETGLDKNTFFLYGNSSAVILSGNLVSGTTLSVNTGSGNSPVENIGIFQKGYLFSGTNNVTLTVDNISYNFTFYPGENLYYLIRYNDGSQSFVLSG